MEASPTISVVIPCHNAARFVEGAVRSAFDQTHPPTETVCVDDGSSDDTLQVLEGLRSDFPDRLNVVAQPHAGACAARNKGLDLVTGTYVQFLDADDELLPDKLSHQADLVRQQNEPDLVAGSYVRHRLDGNRTPFITRPMDPWAALPNIRLGITSANLFKREALLRVKGWDERCLSSQEYDLMFRMMQSGSSVAFDPLPLTIIRQRPRSISNSDPEANLVRRIRLVVTIRDYIRQHGYDDAILEAADTALFFLVRMHCNYDLKQGIDAFHKYFDADYCPPVTDYITNTYVRTFRLLGFPLTQRLRIAAKRLIR